MNSKDYFSLIRDFSHTLGIYLTYTIDHDVVDKIRECNTGRTIIIHDSKHGLTLKNNYESRVICVPAILKSSRSERCFHAKLALLKGEEKTRVIVGSMNLTKNSFDGRHEVCVFNDIKYGSYELNEIIKFLETIKIPDGINIDYLDEFKILDNNQKLNSNNQREFIYNFSRSFSSHLSDRLNGTQPILRIAAPFLSKSFPDKYQEFVQKINPKKVEIYTRSGNKIADQIKNSTYNTTIYKPNLKKSRFHAKIVSIDYGKKIILWLGSGNFTMQGFFKSVSEEGNQECGITMKIDDPGEIKSINKWFNEGWNKPRDAEQDDESGDDVIRDEKETSKTYLFGIKEEGIVKLFIFLPEEETDEIDISVNDKKVFPKKDRDGYYFIELKTLPNNTSFVIVKVLGEPIKVTLFEKENYIKWQKYDGDSLFTYKSTNIESTNINKLKSVIEKEGIVVRSRLNEVREPPVLEKFYKNTRDEMLSIMNRKTFTQAHLNELKFKLKEQEGGTGTYYIMQLIKTFMAVEKKYKISLKSYIDECYENLSSSIKIGDKDEDLHSFVKEWAGL
jgi:hypothetical protein